MSVLWSSSSVVQFTLIIMNKSFQGSIFTYYYLEAISNVIGILIVKQIYKNIGMRKTVVYMLSIALFLMLLVFILEEDTK